MKKARIRGPFPYTTAVSGCCSISLGTYLPSSNLPIAARCTSSGPSARRRVRCMAYQ